jgi:DNA-binding NtrC family response regulator
MGAAKRTVVIVDDDPQVLRLMEKMLRPHHVDLRIVPKPGEVLEICGREPIHLLITDLSMPEMDGYKLAERVVKEQPEARVLLISGVYKEPPPGARNGSILFLQKPFFPSQLIACLKELL